MTLKMKNLLPFLLLFLIMNSACSFFKNTKEKNQAISTESVQYNLKDTCLKINKINCLLLNRNIERGVIIYSNPRLQTNNKIKELNISMLFTKIDEIKFLLSPNEEFVVMNYLTDGYVFKSDMDSVYHENHFYVLFSLKTGQVLKDLNDQESEFTWNNKNQLVDKVSNKIIFMPNEQ